MENICDDVKESILAFLRQRMPKNINLVNEKISLNSTFPAPMPYLFKLSDGKSIGVVCSPDDPTGIHTIEKVPITRTLLPSCGEVIHTPSLVCFHSHYFYYVSIYGNRLFRASLHTNFSELIRPPPNCRKIGGVWSLGEDLVLLSADDHRMYKARGSEWQFVFDLARVNTTVADVALSHDSIGRIQLLQYPSSGEVECYYRRMHNDEPKGKMLTMRLRGAVQMSFLPEGSDGLACVCQQLDDSTRLSATPTASFAVVVVDFISASVLLTSDVFNSFGVVSMVVTDEWYVAVMGEVMIDNFDDEETHRRVALKGMQFEMYSFSIHT